MNINHRLYKNNELTRAGENFSIDQQERLQGFSDEDKETELAKIFNNLVIELGEDKAKIVLAAIKEFIEDVDAVMADGI